MPATAPSDGRPPTHALQVAETVRDQRRAAAAWVDAQLADGAKVYYTARPDDWPSGGTDWLVGPGSAAADAYGSGQLEITDFGRVIELADGTTEGLRRFQTDEVTRGLDEGWARVALTQESPGRPMADRGEIAEFVAQEAGFDDLSRRWPVSTLCQLTLPLENRTAVWETAAVHCGGLVDQQWEARWWRGRWELRGELDTHVVSRFGAALHGALGQRRRVDGSSDLHVDLSAVSFLDVATAQSLALAAYAAARHQRIVLHGATDLVHEVLAAVGVPRSLVLDPDGHP